MIKDFFIENFFLIVKLIIYAGVALCIYAGLEIRENKKKISNDVITDNTDIRKNNIINNKEKISKKTGILMGVGVTAVVVGIILFVIGVMAIIILIYILIHLNEILRGLE